MKRRGSGSVTAAALAVALLVAGCNGSTNGASGSGGSGSMQLTVAATPGVWDAPLYLANQEGLFAKAGLKLTIQPFTTASSELHALSTGQVQVATTDYADFFYAASLDPNLEILADGYDGAPSVMEVLTLPNSPVMTPENLINRTIGTPEPQEFSYQASVPYSMETLVTQSVLLDDGVEPTQVNWTAMPQQDLVGALADHRVDAILVTEPYIYEAESQLGAIPLIDSLSGGTASLPLDGYFTSKSAGRADGDALRAFRTVLEQAQAQAGTGQTLRSSIAHFDNLSIEAADMVTLGSYPALPNVNGIQQVADLMFSFNMVSQELSVSSMMFR
jgi:NitT/TauT family transport system substrate-binding protein